MLAILIYIVAAVAVVCIGLVAVGRETFIASTTLAHITYEVAVASEWIAERLDDRTAARLTPDDVTWILSVDADRLATTTVAPETPGAQVLDDQAAVEAVVKRLDAERAEVISRQDVAAVIALRTRYLESIGAIGPQADGPAE